MDAFLESIGHFLLTVTGLLIAASSVIAAILALRNGARLTEVKHELNSRLTELVEAVRKVAHAEGVAEGRGAPPPPPPPV